MLGILALGPSWRIYNKKGLDSGRRGVGGSVLKIDVFISSSRGTLVTFDCCLQSIPQDGLLRKYERISGCTQF